MPRVQTQAELRLEELRLEEKRRQRFWGTIVLIAIAVIALPLILDGAGTQSPFRRVESLQEEPEAPTGEVISERTVFQPVMPADKDPVVPNQAGELVLPEITGGASSNSVDTEAVTQSETREAPSESRALLTAWVVQAATFSDESDALQLRDRLRKAGFASFVRDRDADSDPFEVLVGPMIKDATAQKAKIRVAKLLKLELPNINTDPEIMVYP